MLQDQQVTPTTPRVGGPLVASVVTVVILAAACLLMLGSGPAPASDQAELSSAHRAAAALGEGRGINPHLASAVTAVTVNESGWLLLVTRDAGVTTAVELCAALADADALPSSPTFVTNSRQSIIHAC